MEQALRPNYWRLPGLPDSIDEWLRRRYGPGKLPRHDVYTGDLARGRESQYRITRSAAGAPAPSVLTIGPTTTVAQFKSAVANTAYDVVEMTAGTYPYRDVRLDYDRSSRPVTIRPAAGATVIFDGTGLGSLIGEVFTIGYNSACRNVVFDGSTGLFKFQNYNIGQTGLFSLYEWSDFAVKGNIQVRNMSHTPLDTTAWCVYIISGSSGNPQRNVRSQRLELGNWDIICDTTNRSVGGFQCYQTNGYGPDHVNIHDCTINYTKVAFLGWGDATDVNVTNVTADNNDKSVSIQNTIAGVMTNFVATNSVQASFRASPNMSYVACSFDK